MVKNINLMSINTISPDLIFNNKFGKLNYIGRDLIKIVLPVKEVFPKKTWYFYIIQTKRILHV